MKKWMFWALAAVGLLWFATRKTSTWAFMHPMGLTMATPQQMARQALDLHRRGVTSLSPTLVVQLEQMAAE